MQTSERYNERYDVIIVGGGPAGLSAALWLGRCRRRVLLCDDGHPRNAAAARSWGLLTRDGSSPLDVLRQTRDELRHYEHIRLCDATVTQTARADADFRVTLVSGQSYTARKLLLATGVVDELPAIHGIEQFYGRSVHHCPYCDAYELRDAPLAAYGQGTKGLALALELTAWSTDLVLCTDGPAELSEHHRRRLAVHGIELREERITGLEGHNGQLTHIRFTTGDSLPRRALFFITQQHERSEFPRQLGCEFNSAGTVETFEHETTCVPGLYVAGDASKRAQMVVIAAAEGASAAADIHAALLKEDLRRVEEQH